MFVLGIGWYAVDAFFVRSVASVSVKIEGAETARVSVQKNGVDVVAVECAGNCALEGIPPFEYDLVAVSEGFKPHSEKIRLERSDRLYRTVSMVRDVRTAEYRKDRTEAIGDIRGKRALLSETGAEAAGRTVLGTFGGTDYFTDVSPKFRLVARTGGKDTVLFASNEKPGIAYSDADGLLWLEAGKLSALFDLRTGTREFPNFGTGVEKIARIGDGSVVTAVASGSVTAFDRTYGSVSKNPLYGDYVLLSGGRVLGLVPKGDTAKASILGFEDALTSRIVLDSGAGNRNVVFESDADYRYLLLENGAVVLESADGSREILENFE